MTFFETVKNSVTVKQAAEHYSCKVNRGDMICCPFHDDRHPSMKLNEDYFYCFGCGTTGDVTDFVARLYAWQLRGSKEAGLLRSNGKTAKCFSLFRTPFTVIAARGTAHTLHRLVQIQPEQKSPVFPRSRIFHPDQRYGRIISIAKQHLRKFHH